MKKLILSFASLCLILYVYSCREPNKEKAEDALEEVEGAMDKGTDELMEEVEETTSTSMDESG